jgi:hypothetical protein
VLRQSHIIKTDIDVLVLRLIKMEKRDLLVDLKEKNTTMTIKDFSQEGVKLEVNSIGEVTGKYDATHAETSENILKNDGTMTWEARAIETTKDGDVIFVNGCGTGEPLKGTEVSVKGELLYLTNSPRLRWLNNTKARVEGVTDTINGEGSFKISTLNPEEEQQIAAPAM